MPVTVCVKEEVRVMAAVTEADPVFDTVIDSEGEAVSVVVGDAILGVGGAD